ncbi:unnamed protein product, partial [Ectocarpus sp. 4 AP-2014]
PKLWDIWWRDRVGDFVLWLLLTGINVQRKLEVGGKASHGGDRQHPASRTLPGGGYNATTTTAEPPCFRARRQDRRSGRGKDYYVPVVEKYICYPAAFYWSTLVH